MGELVFGKEVPFVHLHLHTEFSLLDGATRLISGHDSPLFEECMKLGMPGVAITDHGNMMGTYPAFVQFNNEYKKRMPEGREFNIIYGNEVYTCDDMHVQDSTNRYGYNHLILLAKTQTGLENLIKITTLAYTEGFYVKPRVDLECIRQHSEGLICLSACIAGVIPQYLIQNEYDKALAYAKELQSIFGKEDFYIELQDHDLPEEKMILSQLVKIANEIGAKVVATNDVHYLKKEDYDAHDIMLRIQTGKRVGEEIGMGFNSNNWYLKSYEEMLDKFKWIPEALTNTVEIMNKCKSVKWIEHQLEKLYPKYDKFCPEGETPETYLRKLCFEGLKRRYGEKLSDVHIDRANTELGVIHNKGFDSYYLVVWDFINWAKSNDIPIGPGRGSGVGSIVAYAIGITNVEPLQFDLLFERFLNPERNSPPDFDIDICTERRGEVIDYVVKKYGRDHVCQILTLGTLKPKNAIADVARVYNVPLELVNKTKKMLPNDPKMTFKSALGLAKDKDGNPIPGIQEFIDLYNTNDEMHQVIDMARKLEGMPKNISMHAAGVVICDTAVINACPELVQKKKDKVDIITQFQKGETEELGLLKMDFLGLITLTDIHHAIKYVYEQTEEKIDFDKIGVGDAGVYEMISNGDTDFVFQLDSGGMKNFMKQLHPNNIEDLILGISMYRPGPMDSISDYLKARANPESVHYFHDCLRPILEPTFGFFVYQEQVMNAARVMGGYSLGQADLLRRAMGKKKVEVMQKERARFEAGAAENGVDADVAKKTFDAMEKFATYAFNKSHAAAYAHVTYQTAYLKKYHLTELVCAMLNNRITKTDKLLKYINLAKQYGVEILPADVNKSGAVFKVEDGKVRFGLTAIKNIGGPVADEIEKEVKANGPFKSLTDFCSRLDPKVANKTTIENCAKAGAMDCFGKTRSTIMANYAHVLGVVASDKKIKASGQMSMFDFMDSTEDETEKLIEIPEYKKLDILAMEKEVLNTYLSGHPLEEFKTTLEKYPFNLGKISLLLNTFEDDTEDDESQVNMLEYNEDEVDKEEIERLTKEYDGKVVKIAGLLDNYQKKKTKTNKMMGIGTLMDLHSSIDVLFCGNAFENYKDVLKNDIVVEVSGKLRVKEGQASLSAQTVKLLNLEESEKKVKKNTQARIMYLKGDDNSTLNKILKTIENIVGEPNDECVDEIKVQYNKKIYAYPDKVNITDSIEMMMEKQFGMDGVKIRPLV